MAKKKSPLSTSVYDALLDPSEVITEEDEAALASEAAGEAPVVEEKPVEEEPAPEPPPAEAKPEAKEEPAKEPEDEEGEKPRSRAQERIRELVAARNELEAKIKLQEERWQRLEERQKLISDEQTKAKADEVRAAEEAAKLATRPDSSIDPIGAELWDLREHNKKLEERVAASEKSFVERSEETRQRVEVQAFSTALNQDLANFRAAHADYDEAAQFVTQARQEFWQNLGRTPEEAFHLVQQEALAIAKSALDNGKSPAESYYKLATQWGFKAPATKETPAPEAKLPSPKEKLETIAKGQERTGFGRTANALEEGGDLDIMSLSPAQLADMGEEQFLMILKDPQKRSLLEKRVAQLELS
jgi:hypothetical protein